MRPAVLAATASVGASTAPSTHAIANGTLGAAHVATPPMTSVVTTTSPTARTRIGREEPRSSR